MEYYLYKLLDNDIRLLEAIQNADILKEVQKKCIPYIDIQIKNLQQVKQGVGQIPAHLNRLN